MLSCLSTSTLDMYILFYVYWTGHKTAAQSHSENTWGGADLVAVCDALGLENAGIVGRGKCWLWPVDGKEYLISNLFIC